MQPIRFRKVDLPDPLLPMIATHSPASMVTETSRNATTGTFPCK